MIHSMTGFGKASVQLPLKKLTIEIKSLNSKSLDLSVRLSQQYKEKELEVRNVIAQRLERGKIECSLYIEVTGEETSSTINAPIVKSYIQQMKNIIPDADATELMKMAVRMPDALKVERAELNEEEWKEIQKILNEALNNIVEFRRQEGAKLQNDFEQQIGSIRILMDEVATYETERINAVKERLRQGLEELKVNTDQNRFEQELRSEEHTSELQSRPHFVCRLLLEKKKKPLARNMDQSFVCCTSWRYLWTKSRGNCSKWR